MNYKINGLVGKHKYYCISSDVIGPQALGIKVILVRSEKVEGVLYYSENLLGLKEIIK